MIKLKREFYNRDTTLVAQELLGKLLVISSEVGRQVGRIVEVEAYLGPHDLAAHSAKGLTKRTEVMFGPPGHAYVYLIYGMYYCLNAVTQEAGHASAVLIRAIEPIENITGKTSGPGLLCKALHITKAQNGQDLLSDSLYIADDGFSNFEIVERPRIGVDYAGEWAIKPLRFYIQGNHYISKK